MKSTRQSNHSDLPYPQPFTEPGVKLPQHFQNEDVEPRSCVRGTEREAQEAFDAWLRHVEAGRIGGTD